MTEVSGSWSSLLLKVRAHCQKNYWMSEYLLFLLLLHIPVLVPLFLLVLPLFLLLLLLFLLLLLLLLFQHFPLFHLLFCSFVRTWGRSRVGWRGFQFMKSRWSKTKQSPPPPSPPPKKKNSDEQTNWKKETNMRENRKKVLCAYVNCVSVHECMYSCIACMTVCTVIHHYCTTHCCHCCFSPNWWLYVFCFFFYFGFSFTDTLTHIRNRHSSVVETMAQVRNQTVDRD